MTLVLPELAALRDNIVNDNEDWRTVAVSGLLRLASLNPAAFKSVLGNMEEDGRRRLESLLRIAFEGQQEKKIEEAKPSISLTLDFGAIE